ncbi:transposable element Tcb1 transposase [Trichonephila clavipes]|nr:transposable element Tcb1 transposase [Trichonephila clavipes]
MPRGRHRTSFDQVSEFDGRRIVAYRDCGLSFKKIGLRVGRNPATVIRICHRTIQEEATERRGRSHRPSGTTARDGRQYGKTRDLSCQNIRENNKTSQSAKAAVAEWSRYRIVAGLATSSSPVPLKTRSVGQRCKRPPVGVVWYFLECSHGNLVVMVMNSWSAGHEFEPNATDKLFAEELMHAQSVKGQNPPIGVDVRRGVN